MKSIFKPKKMAVMLTIIGLGSAPSFGRSGENMSSGDHTKGESSKRDTKAGSTNKNDASKNSNPQNEHKNRGNSGDTKQNNAGKCDKNSSDCKTTHKKNSPRNDPRNNLNGHNHKNAAQQVPTEGHPARSGKGHSMVRGNASEVNIHADASKVNIPAIRDNSVVNVDTSGH